MPTDNIGTDNRGTDNIRRDEEWVFGGIFHLVSFNFICSHCDKIKTRKFLVVIDVSFFNCRHHQQNISEKVQIQNIYWLH
jgi:hypothetical protein